LSVSLSKAAKSHTRMNVALEYACKAGRSWMIERILVNETSFYTLSNAGTGPEKLTPLMLIVEFADSTEDPPWDLASMLVLRFGAEVNAVDAHSASALHHAVHHGNAKLAEALVNLRADILQCGGRGETVLSFAAMSDHPCMCEWALQRLCQSSKKQASYKDLLDAVDKCGYTALCHAAQGNEQQAARWLLQRRADVNAGAALHDKNRICPLSLAALEGHTHMLGVLLRNGAVLSFNSARMHPDSQHWFSLHAWQIAVPHEASMHEQRRCLLDKLHDSVKTGELLDVDADIRGVGYEHSHDAVDAPDMQGRSAVLVCAQHRASSYFRPRLSKLVDEYGGQLRIVDDRGTNALMLAVQRCGQDCFDIIKALMARSPDLAFMPDAEDQSAAFHCLIFHTGKEALDRLQLVTIGQQGSDVGLFLKLDATLPQKISRHLAVLNCQGWNLLHQAASCGHADALTWLLDSLRHIGSIRGSNSELLATTNLRAHDGASPLLLAASNGCTRSCSALLKAHADINAAYNNGRNIHSCIAGLPPAAQQSMLALCQAQNPKETDTKPALVAIPPSDQGADGSSSPGAPAALNQGGSRIKKFGIAAASSFVRWRGKDSSNGTKGREEEKSMSAPSPEDPPPGQIDSLNSQNVPKSSHGKQDHGHHSKHHKHPHTCKKHPDTSGETTENQTVIATTDENTAPPTCAHNGHAQRHRPRKKRWPCTFCSKPNVGDKQTCSFCGESATPPSSVIVTNDHGFKLHFLLSKNVRGKNELQCFINGKLESRITKIILREAACLVEDIGHEYDKHGVEQTTKTKSSFHVPLDHWKNVTDTLHALAAQAHIKVTSSETDTKTDDQAPAQ